MHACSESRNPRYAGWCDCGRRLTESVATKPRNKQFEIDFIKHACQRYVDPQPLIDRMLFRSSQSREYGQPDHVRVGVNWIREFKNELEDGPFYGAQWALERMDQEPDAYRQWLMAQAIRHVAQAHRFLSELEDDQ